MRIKFDKETDTIYIRFSDLAVAESEEQREGVILDFDLAGEIVGIEILNASKRTASPARVEYEMAA